MKWNLCISTLEVELFLPCILPQLKRELAAFLRCYYPLKMEPLNYRIPNMEPDAFQMQENPFKDRGNNTENTISE